MISWSLSDVAGVNFGDSHIAVARLRGKRGGRFALTHAGWMAYSPGASEKEVAGVLRKLWRQTNMPTTTVVASLRSAGLVVRYFKHPIMPEPELRAALELQAEESLQVTRDQLVMDWHLNVGEAGQAAGEAQLLTGIMAAAPAKDVERWLGILVAAGLDPLVLDVRALAIANLYEQLGDKRGDSTTCVVSLAPHSADVVVLTDRGTVYPHTVYCRSSTWAESPSFLCENVRDVLKYSEFKLDWPPAQRVILTGMVPGTESFMADVQEGVRLPVEKWDPLRTVDVASRQLAARIDSAPGEATMLVPSLGLAIRGE